MQSGASAPLKGVWYDGVTTVEDLTPRDYSTFSLSTKFYLRAGDSNSRPDKEWGVLTKC